jgi:hypothetical protein
MRRRAIQALLLGAASVAVLVVPSTPAGAVGDVNGPACADIDDGTGFYDGDVLHFRIRHSASTCPSVTTKLSVFDEATSRTPLANFPQKGNGQSTDLFYDVPINDNDETICLTATTSAIRRWRGAQVFDRAPDTQCLEILANDPNPPGRRFR